MLKNLTVLYVEDDKLTRQLTKMALENLVKKVYLAKDGIEGLKLYQEISPNIVLTDMYMPKMNGLEMSQKIKELQPEQVIGLFTGDAKNTISQNYSLHTIDTYLVKPLSRKQFLNSLNYLSELALSQ